MGSSEKFHYQIFGSKLINKYNITFTILFVINIYTLVNMWKIL